MVRYNWAAAFNHLMPLASRISYTNRNVRHCGRLLQRMTLNVYRLYNYDRRQLFVLLIEKSIIAAIIRQSHWCSRDAANWWAVTNDSLLAIVINSSRVVVEYTTWIIREYRSLSAHLIPSQRDVASNNHLLNGEFYDDAFCSLGYGGWVD